MDFDNAKENIQPLASGRNVHQLEIALCNDADAQSELHQQRQQFESNIQAYTGDDPIELWYEYILWLEQSYPKSGKDSAMDDVLVQCLIKFENEEKYKQDHRMIKLYIKYIDSQTDPQENYQILYNSGIGTKLAELYIGWAYYYDICDNFEKCEDIFQKGKDAGAEPKDVLEQAHKNFGFSMSQRILKKMDRNDFLTTMAENRYALTSLQGYRKKNAIGSIRTGSIVKSFTPGTVKQDVDRNLSTKMSQQQQHQRSNAGIVVFNENIDNAASLPIVDTQPSSVVATIINSSKRQENLREPGPWSKAQKDNKKSASANLYKNCNQSIVNFTIHADDNDEQSPIDPYKIPLCDNVQAIDLSIQLPKNFVRQNAPHASFDVPIFAEEEILPYRIPAYDKIRIYPRPGKVFSIEELAAYNWFKRMNIQNDFTARHDEYWCNGIEYPIRLPPLFCRSNLPQSVMIYNEKPDKEPPKNCKFMFSWMALYTDDCNEKSSFEEMLREKYLNGELRSQLAKIELMDETMPVAGRKSMYRGAIRKSIMPGCAGRKTILPPMNQTIFVREENEDDDEDLHEDSMTENIPKDTNNLINESKRTVPLIFSNSRSQIMPRKSILKVPQATDEHKISTTVATGAIPKIIKSKRKTIESGMADDDRISVKEICPSERRQAVNQKESPSEYPNFNAEPPVVSQFSIFQDFADTNDINQPKIEAKLTQPISGDAVKSLQTPKPIVETHVAVVNKQLSIQPTCQFEIFQDTDTIKSPPTTTAPIEFKTPKAPISMPQKSNNAVIASSTLAAPVAAAPVAAAPAIVDVENIDENHYLPNDSFSTQNFNYFIKAQSISTPISNKRKPPLSVIPPEEISPPTSNDHIPADILTPTTTTQPRQLSIIMETTETTNTKSSVDTQLINSSPESVVGGNCTTATTTQNFVATTKMHSNLLMPSENNANDQQPTDEQQQKNFELSQLNELPSICSATTSTGDMTSFNLFSDPINILPAKPFIAPAIAVAPQPPLQPIEIYIDKTEDIPKTALKSLAAHPFEAAAKENIIIEVSSNENATQKIDENMMHQQSHKFPIYHDETVPTINACNAIYEEKTDIIPNQLLISNRTEKTFLPYANESMQQPPSIMQSILCNETNDMKTDQIPTDVLIKNNKLTDDSLQPLSIMPSICHQTNELEDLFTTTPVKQKNSFRAVRKDEQQPIPSISNALSTSTDKFVRPSKIPMRHTQIPIPTKNSSMREDSLHIKEEVIDFQSPMIPSIITKSNEPKQQQQEIMIDFASARHISKFEKSDAALLLQNDDDDDENFIDNIPAELSIYVQRSSQPIESSNENDDENWNEIDQDFDITENNDYLTTDIDLNQTNQIIEQHLCDPNVDPWDDELKNLLLDRVYFLDYLSKMPSNECNMVEKIGPLKLRENYEFCNQNFVVQSLLGQGKFGRVYSAKNVVDDKIYALKQERPPNLWEYYICLEIVSRIQHKHILDGLMTIPHAFIAKNASIFVSQYSSYGTLIDVCNKVKKVSGKNVSEYVTMVLTNQMLLILDHLHAVNIIHGDIKPDNILLMKKINSDRPDIVIQLIDFGQSIDLKLYKKDQQFYTKLSTKNFMCTEMLDNRPWTYQTDLYCLAGTIHTILFGSYMEVIKKINSYAPKMIIPRYYDKLMWETIFDSLINVRGNNMPNLQTMRDNLQKKIVLNEKKVCESVMNFNRYIDL